MSTQDNSLTEETPVSLDEIEQAYLRALDVAEGFDTFIPQEAETHQEPAAQTDPVPSQSVTAAAPELDTAAEESVTPSQVIEALLFVGGEALPAKKMREILGGTMTHEQVDEEIEQLNQRYLDERRPYEIWLVEGGYRMVVRSEFDAVRSRVYGQGPKDVKLNQETLEVLALIAYKQPVSRADFHGLGKRNVSSLLRQLLRRQLIVLERDSDAGTERYSTTKRFLEVFGLTSIDDLPQAVDFNFK